MKQIKICLALISVPFLIKSQISSPYPVYNNSSCEIEIAYEVFNDHLNCKALCDNGTTTIPPGGVVYIADPSICHNGIFDVHIVLMQIEGQSLTCSQGGGASNSVGDMSTNCINSTAASINCTYPSGISCTGTWNLMYTLSGTTFW